MPTSTVLRYEGDAAETEFTSPSVNVGISELIVKVDGVTQTVTTDYTYDNDSDLVTFVAPPASSAFIELIRFTDVDLAAVTLQRSGIANEVQLNKNFNQAIAKLQELVDQQLLEVVEASQISAGNNEVVDVANPTLPDSAATKDWVENVFNAGYRNSTLTLVSDVSYSTVTKQFTKDTVELTYVNGALSSVGDVVTTTVLTAVPLEAAINTIDLSGAIAGDAEGELVIAQDSGDNTKKLVRVWKKHTFTLTGGVGDGDYAFTFATAFDLAPHTFQVSVDWTVPTDTTMIVDYKNLTASGADITLIKASSGVGIGGQSFTVNILAEGIRTIV